MPAVLRMTSAAVFSSASGSTPPSRRASFVRERGGGELRGRGIPRSALDADQQARLCLHAEHRGTGIIESQQKSQRSHFVRAVRDGS